MQTNKIRTESLYTMPVIVNLKDKEARITARKKAKIKAKKKRARAKVKRAIRERRAREREQRKQHKQHKRGKRLLAYMSREFNRLFLDVDRFYYLVRHGCIVFGG